MISPLHCSILSDRSVTTTKILLIDAAIKIDTVETIGKNLFQTHEYSHNHELLNVLLMNIRINITIELTQVSHWIVDDIVHLEVKLHMVIQKCNPQNDTNQTINVEQREYI